MEVGHAAHQNPKTAKMLNPKPSPYLHQYQSAAWAFCKP
jgi:hypothetical protein